MSARTRMFLAATLLAGMVLACNTGSSAVHEAAIKLQLTSTAFADGQPIPSRNTCDGQNLSPALQWSDVPPAAQSLALICDDPDAPVGTWVHWVIYSLPPGTNGLPEGVPPSLQLPDGSMQGENDFKQTGYGGPCPPSGNPHRYFFRLYALDSKPDLKPGLTKGDLLKTMKGHIIAEGQLMGTYQRK